MTREDFEEWKQWWYRMVPRCENFICCHELTSCGIDRLCGDCTVYETWQNYRDILSNKVTCTDVGCEDCMLKYDCIRRVI